MQRKTKLALAVTLVAALAGAAGVALADGGAKVKGHEGHGMPMMDGGMMGGGMMGGAMMGPQIDFTAADTNKDGKVTADELAAWRAAEVASIDSNKDGKLSADEIAAFETKQISARIKDHATKMVARLDTDGDGLLSAAELLAAPMDMTDFQRLDRNGDGALTPDELAAPMGHMGNPPPAAPADGTTGN